MSHRHCTGGCHGVMLGTNQAWPWVLGPVSAALGAGPRGCGSGCWAALVLPEVLSCSPVGGLPPRCGAASEYCQCNVKEMAPSCAEMTCVASSTYQSDTIN